MKRAAFLYIAITLAATSVALPQDQNTFPGTGNAGIGTTNPRGALHILRPGVPPRISSKYRAPGTTPGSPGSRPAVNGLLLGIENTSGYKWIQSYDGALALNPLGNRVGIGTTSPETLLHLRAEAPVITVEATNLDSGLRVNAIGLDADGDQAFRVQADGTELLSVEKGGYVGIGTTDPDRQLTIKGSEDTFMNVIGFDGQHEVLLGVDINGGIVSTMTNHDLQLRAGGNSPKMTIKADGRVGIGTLDPVARLEVSGGMPAGRGRHYNERYEQWAQWRRGVGLLVFSDNNRAIEAYYGPDPFGPGRTVAYLASRDSGVEGASQYGTGVWGSSSEGTGVYGWSATGYAGDFDGNVKIRKTLHVGERIEVEDVPVWNGPPEFDLTWHGSTTWPGSTRTRREGSSIISREGSSRRYKQNIRPFQENFRNILQLEARQYQMREGYGEPEQWLFGYIAEELEEVGLTKLVTHDSEGRPDGIKYKKMCIYLTEIAKEHEQEIVELKNDIAKLSETVNKLEKALNLRTP